MLHRLLGSGLSLAFVVWFISGFVMLFSGFPHANKESQFTRQKVFVENDSITSILHESTPTLLDGLSLEKVNQKPVFRISYSDGNKKLVDAKTLKPIHSINSSELDEIVKQHYKSAVQKKIILSDFDAWIPWSHYKKYFPIHKYYLADSEHSVIYMSERTGEIVQETTRKQRWLARFGAIPHWYYFKSLRLKKELWIKVVVWVSGIGSIMCLFGIILGFYRYRKRKKNKNSGIFSFSPYKKKWYKWHHISGFFFGLFTFTFVFSGMMSLQKVPEKIIPVETGMNYPKVWNENIHQINDFKLPVNKLFENEQLKSVRKVDWIFSIKGSPCYLVYSNNFYQPVIVDASQSDSLKILNLTLKDIENEFQEKFKGVQYTCQNLTSSDGYYMQSKRHPFPVIKFTINNKDKTWIYINPYSLKLIKTYNKNTRLRRWLYKGLHSFDFKFLVKNNWLRLSILILLSIFGTIISISGVVLSFNYIKRKSKKYF
jgi:hypothetical protein